MEKFCDTLPTEEELLVYVNNILEVRRIEIISFYDAKSANTQVTVIVFNGTSVQHGLVHIVYMFNVKQIGEWTQITSVEPLIIPVRTSFSDSEHILDHLVGIPDPYTVARIVRKRKSCMKMHDETNSDEEYGVELATTYMRAVLAPFFSKIVTNVAQLYDSVPPKPPREQLMTIPDNDDAITHQFEADLERVKLLVWGWLQLRGSRQLIDYAAEWEAPEDIETIRIAASTMVEEYVTKAAVDRHVQTEEEEEENDKELPTRQEISDWLKNELRNNRPVNIRLFDSSFRVVTITTLGRGILLLTVSRLDIHKRGREYRFRIVTDLPIKLNPNLDKDAQTLITNLYGLLDPTTMLAIMKSREEAAPDSDDSEAEEDSQYGEAEVQHYIRSVINYVTHHFIESDNMEALHFSREALMYLEQNLSEENVEANVTRHERLTNIWKLYVVVYTWLTGEPIPVLLGNQDEVVSAFKRYVRFYNELTIQSTQQDKDSDSNEEESDGEEEED